MLFLVLMDFKYKKMDDVVVGYENKPDLINKLIEKYVYILQKRSASFTRILGDANWASTDSPYHKKCRSDMEEDLKEVNKQIKMLNRNEKRI